MKLDKFSAEVMVGGKPLKEHRRGDRPKSSECTVAYSLQRGETRQERERLARRRRRLRGARPRRVRRLHARQSI